MSALLRLMLLFCLGTATSVSAATFTFRFNDGPDEGFNDPTPFTPLPGNTATTLGEARRNVLIEAGRIWGDLLISDVPIVVDAEFNPQECSANSGTLASAGARTFFRDFAAGISPETFFASALADSLAGEDLMLQTENPNDPDIRVTFNSSIDSNPTCLNGVGFYYGFNHVGNRFDALIVALHELAHGFGFTSEIDTQTGMGFTDGRFSSFVLQIFDERLGRPWSMLSAAERVASAVGNPGLAWNGTNVNAQTGLFAIGATAQGRLRLFAPAPASPGSSVSHWDETVNPNILMEPNLSSSLVTNFVEVTVCALRDIGWQTTRCPDTPDRGPTPIVNSQPISVTIMEDSNRIDIPVDASDPDLQNAPLIIAVSAPRPQKGTAIGSVGFLPQVLYTPRPNANGLDTFNFTASDGGTISTPGTISITIIPVNDRPSAINSSIDVTSGQPAAIGLTATDVDGDPLSFEIVTDPSFGTLSGSGAMRTYQSNPGFTGSDLVQFRVSDAVSTSVPAIVSINVRPAATTTPVPPMPPPPTPTPTPGGRGGGGGGGGMSELLLLALALLALAARLDKARLPSFARRG